MGKVIDLTGRRFGRLVVEEKTDKTQNRYAVWKCKCDCGNEVCVTSCNLKNGSTRSCGCLARELTIERSRKHDMSRTRLYKIRRGMIDRCYRRKNMAYENYGGRGITVCDEWLNSFEAYAEWALSHGYSDNMTIDRIDNDKGYSPDNCRWVSMKKQQNNRTNNVRIEHNGITHTLKEWSDMLGINYSTLCGRWYSGWSVDRLLATTD